MFTSADFFALFSTRRCICYNMLTVNKKAWIVSSSHSICALSFHSHSMCALVVLLSDTFWCHKWHVSFIVIYLKVCDSPWIYRSFQFQFSLTLHVLQSTSAIPNEIHSTSFLLSICFHRIDLDCSCSQNHTQKDTFECFIRTIDCKHSKVGLTILRSTNCQLLMSEHCTRTFTECEYWTISNQNRLTLQSYCHSHEGFSE